MTWAEICQSFQMLLRLLLERFLFYVLCCLCFFSICCSFRRHCGYSLYVDWLSGFSHDVLCLDVPFSEDCEICFNEDIELRRPCLCTLLICHRCVHVVHVFVRDVFHVQVHRARAGGARLLPCVLPNYENLLGPLLPS